MSKPYRKYIDKKMVTKIEEIKKQQETKGKVCSFSKASKILAERV
jgi:hypothetical protein